MVIGYLQMYGLKWLIETKCSQTWGSTPSIALMAYGTARIQGVPCSTGVSDMCPGAGECVQLGLLWIQSTWASYDKLLELLGDNSCNRTEITVRDMALCIFHPFL